MAKKHKKDYKWYGCIIGLIIGIIVVLNQFYPFPEPLGGFFTALNLISYIQLSESMVLFPLGLTLAFWAIIGILFGWLAEQI